MYTALVLTEQSQRDLRNHFRDIIPSEWDIKCHHMTINMGLAVHGPAAELLGKEFDIKVITLAHDQKVMAVGIETEVLSKNSVKHITLAVNVRDGGKPKHSNELTNWKPLSENSVAVLAKLELKGIVQEVE